MSILCGSNYLQCGVDCIVSATIFLKKNGYMRLCHAMLHEYLNFIEFHFFIYHLVV